MSTVRVAAMADTHLGDGTIDSHWEYVLSSTVFDVLLLAGDLTEHGEPTEFEAFGARIRSATSVPVLAVLGNHDVQLLDTSQIRGLLASFDIQVLDGECAMLRFGRSELAVVGAKGYWGGWDQSPLGYEEPAMRACETALASQCAQLRRALEAGNPGTTTIAMTHYVPTPGGLRGEGEAVHCFLGASALGRVLAARPVDVILHGHAHRGAEVSYLGSTPTYNAAYPLRQAPLFFELDLREAT